jgi:hypothetical protein
MISINNTKPAFPLAFQKCFWDVAFDELSFEKYPGFITERLLNYGDLNAIKWLLSYTNIQYIKSVIENNRNLNAKTKKLLANNVNISSILARICTKGYTKQLLTPLWRKSPALGGTSCDLCQCINS